MIIKLALRKLAQATKPLPLFFGLVLGASCVYAQVQPPPPVGAFDLVGSTWTALSAPSAALAQTLTYTPPPGALYCQYTATATSFSITSNVATVIATNTFTVGEQPLLFGFTTATYFNNQVVTIASASGSQFTFNFTHANVTSTSDTGTANLWVPATSACLGGSGGGGTTTNALVFNNSGTGGASGLSFNGGTAGQIVSFNTIGAAPAAGAVSNHVVYASRGNATLSLAACALNSNLTTGGGTDDTLCLQNILDTLETTYGGGVLALDGAALISGTLQTSSHPSCLQLHSNETIQGIGGGAGWYLANSSNCTMLSNAVTGNPAATFETNMALYDLTLNGNIANQSKYEQGLNTNGWAEGMWFGGFNGLVLKNIVCHNCDNFSFVVSNFNGFFYNNLRTLQDSVVANTDAVHIWGPANWIRGDTLRSNGDDDTLALNTDEGVCIFNATTICAVTEGFANGSGWGSTVNRYPQSGGNITNATFSNTFFDSAAAGVRFNGNATTGGTTVLNDITIENTYGSLSTIPMACSGVTNAAGPINIRNWFVTGANNSINACVTPTFLDGVPIGVTATISGNTPQLLCGSQPCVIGPSATGQVEIQSDQIGINRNTGTGSIPNGNESAYQFSHSGSTTQASDNICWQIYPRTGGSAVDSFAQCMAGNANSGFGTKTPAWKLTVGANVAGFDTAGLLHSAVGTAIASASTIAIVSPVTHITGTTTINVMNVSAGCAISGTGCQVTVIPDGLWSTATGGGNGGFSIATTAVVGQPIIFTFDNATQLWYPTYGAGVALALNVPNGTATFTPGAGVTSVVCATSFTCTNTRGVLTIVGGTATTGTIATVNFSTTLTAAPGNCLVVMDGGSGFLGLGHGVPSTASFTITAGIAVTGITLTADYLCTP